MRSICQTFSSVASAVMQIFPWSLTVKTMSIKFKRNELNNDNKVETAIAGLNCWASYVYETFSLSLVLKLIADCVFF